VSAQLPGEPGWVHPELDQSGCTDVVQLWLAGSDEPVLVVALLPPPVGPDTAEDVPLRTLTLTRHRFAYHHPWPSEPVVLHVARAPEGNVVAVGPVRSDQPIGDPGPAGRRVTRHVSVGNMSQLVIGGLRLAEIIAGQCYQRLDPVQDGDEIRIKFVATVGRTVVVWEP
jgi:hypothetical protein